MATIILVWAVVVLAFCIVDYYIWRKKQKRLMRRVIDVTNLLSTEREYITYDPPD